MPNKFTPKRNPIYVIGPSIAYVPLTLGFQALVDSDIAESLCQWNWSAKVTPRGAVYARRSQIVNGKAETVSLHRFIFGIQGKSFVDHKNRNTLDNRRDNLREATNTQNNYNSSRKPNASGYKGVRLSTKQPGKFEAVISVNNRYVYLGAFHCPILASDAYFAAAKQYAGEFATRSVLEKES